MECFGISALLRQCLCQPACLIASIPPFSGVPESTSLCNRNVQRFVPTYGTPSSVFRCDGKPEMTSPQWYAVPLSRALRSIVILGLLIVGPVEALHAKDTNSIPSSSTREEPEGPDKGDSSRPLNGEVDSSGKHSQSDHSALDVNPITGVGSVSAANYKRLTGRERWHLYIKQNFTTVGAYLGVFMGSILDQAQDQPPEWQQGMSGYGQRFLSRFGTGVVQGSIQSSACALIGHDTRYIRSKSEEPWHRVGHAFVYSLVTYNNEGKPRPAIATLGSYYASSMIATSWLPNRYTALGDGVRDGNRQVLLAGFANLVQEFWPEIKKIVSRK